MPSATPWPPTPPQPALRTAVALELGVGRGELAGPRWRAPMRGVQVPVGPDPHDPVQRILEVAELLPDGAAVGGWAAAHLLGATDLDGRAPDGRTLLPVPVVLPPPLLVRARPGLVLRWRSALADDDVETVAGVPVCAAVRAAFDHGRKSGLRPGVSGLDVICRQLGIGPADVAEYARAHRRWQGLPLLRAQLRLCDPRSLSPGETQLRLVWVLDAALPPPVANPRVFDGSGTFLGMVDLLDPETGLAGEYDGAHHRDPLQHCLDNAREEGLEDGGLVVVRAGALDLGRYRRRTVARLQSGQRRARAQGRGAWTWRPSA